jgi:hypothetical protein
VPRGSTFISHWGLTVPWKHRSDPQNRNSSHDGEPCAVRGTDIIVPMYFRFNQSWLRESGAAEASRRKYECELFFAGSFDPPGCRAGSKLPAECSDVGYSQGVRQAVKAHHSTRRGFCLFRRAPKTYFSRSRFCLVTSGNGFSSRLYHAMNCNCVPVIIQPAVMQPFEGIVPYERFSLRLSHADVPQLHTLLRNVSAEAHWQMRRQLAIWRHALDWNELAYDLVKYELCLRAGLSCTSLRTGWQSKLDAVADQVLGLGRVVRERSRSLVQ